MLRRPDPRAARRGGDPFIGLTLVPIAMRSPLVLMPIHIALLHLTIDPACSVEGQPEEADVMQRLAWPSGGPPRAPPR